MLKIILAFSELMRPEILAMGESKALNYLLELLERQDIFILRKKDGPMLHALLSHFGLIEPINNRERLDGLDAQTVCKVLIQWKLLALKAHQYSIDFKKPSGSEMIPTRDLMAAQLESKEK